MTQDHPAVDGSALCTACGLCCDGTLFHRANSKPEEEATLIAQGMEVVQTPRGPKFALPCHHLQGTRCGIYEHRFRTCRGFKCQLLLKVEGGQQGLDEAMGAVAQARSLRASAAALDPVAANYGGRLELFKALKDWNKTPDMETRRGQGRLVLAMTILDQFLDQHFRVRRKKTEPDPQPDGKA